MCVKILGQCPAQEDLLSTSFGEVFLFLLLQDISTDALIDQSAHLKIL